MSPEIVPFRIAVPDADLRDLRERLGRTRWPEAETVDDWSQGIPLAYLQELCRYWARDYDWRGAERRLNAFPQFRTEIDGLGIHFIHARSANPDALPLIVTHGWPGSIVEFHKVIEPLTDDFHVVCPSLPGYGFSDKPARPGWGVARIARAWAQLMARLGYEHYGAQGGDWGAIVTASLAQQDEGHLVAIHVTMPLVAPDPATFDELSDRERDALAATEHYRQWEYGYAKQQSTRPQTLGYALTDSPAGQCAWIVEKFQAWSDCDGHPENAVTRDDMLDDVTLYWLTATAASAARLYWESFEKPNLDPVTVPTGCSIFPKEIVRPSRRWVERRFSDLRSWSEPARGGHFAALEQPEIFVDEVRSFFGGC